MASYIQIMPGVYQTIIDPNADVKAANKRLEIFRKTLKEFIGSGKEGNYNIKNGELVRIGGKT